MPADHKTVWILALGHGHPFVLARRLRPFRPLTDSLLERDEYTLLADYASYIETQEAVDRAFDSVEMWTRMSIFNVARIGNVLFGPLDPRILAGIWNIQSVT